jgi:carboxyl-terminal processing protease
MNPTFDPAPDASRDPFRGPWARLPEGPSGAPPTRPFHRARQTTATLLVVAAVAIVSFAGGLQAGRDAGPRPALAGAADTPITAASALPPASASDKLPLLYEAWNLVLQHYVDRSALDPTRLTYGAIRGLIASLDDTGHSDFLTPQESADSTADLSGQYVGIGVELTMRDDVVVIVSVFDESPAAAAGLRPGDRIVAIDGEDMAGKAFQDVRTRVRGPSGTTVTISVLRGNETSPRDFVVTRGQIHVPNVTWAMIPGRTTADIRLSQFASGSADDLVAALRAARDKGAKSIVFDLRGNPGGYVDEAVRIASQFLTSGVVYIERNAEGTTKETPVRPDGIATDLPLVVLVDQGSASSSEIVAGAIQDAGRAKLVGEKTFGTGTVLNSFKLPDGSEVRLGVAEWLTPKGRQIWRAGIEPDVTVALAAGALPLSARELQSMSAAELANSSDSQLLAALRLLDGGA